jgi:diaminopimelate epimerase
MRFLKGHGTGNDFVVVPDPDGALDLRPELVAALCDRRFGIGGDGVLRVVRSAAAGVDGVDGAAGPQWFMDYRNSDGSLAEMCGNGARVFARFLVDHGYVTGTEFEFGTRAGVTRAVVSADAVAVSMRRPRINGRGEVRLGPLTVSGEAVDVGNPHLVCRVPDVSVIDLREPPGYDRDAFPAGVNVEVVEGDATGGRMRVYERGSGETLSCGTGACAVAAVLLGGGTGTVPVDVPGGRVTVTIEADRCWLAGPAVLVADGIYLIDEVPALRPL